MNKKSGLTLIEVLIYTGLLIIILGLITNFFYQLANFKVNIQINSSLFQNSQLLINKISQDVKRADEVTIPNSQDFSNTLVVETESGQITYQVDKGILQRNGLALTDESVEVDLGSPDKGFRKVGNSVQLRIGMTSKQRPFGQLSQEKIYQTAISLRN